MADEQRGDEVRLVPIKRRDHDALLRLHGVEVAWDAGITEDDALCKPCPSCQGDPYSIGGCVDCENTGVDEPSGAFAVRCPACRRRRDEVDGGTQLCTHPFHFDGDEVRVGWARDSPGRIHRSCNVACGICEGATFMLTCHHAHGTGHEWVLCSICVGCREVHWVDTGCPDCKAAVGA